MFAPLLAALPGDEQDRVYGVWSTWYWGRPHTTGLTHVKLPSHGTWFRNNNEHICHIEVCALPVRFRRFAKQMFWSLLLVVFLYLSPLLFSPKQTKKLQDCDVAVIDI
jgi:hypothetical protein